MLGISVAVIASEGGEQTPGIGGRFGGAAERLERPGTRDDEVVEGDAASGVP